VATINQNGAGVGRVAGVQVDDDGAIGLNFTNGQRKTIAYVALATFANVDGLAPEAGNNFRESVASGNPTFTAANSGGAGSIAGQSLEASTVDIAAELSDMIITQNAYAANVKTITTADEMLKLLDRMKQ
jgi:flagellar hook protein FlgE